MRRLPALSLSLLAVLALAACSSGAAPGWTYAPAASASAVASGAASGQPSGAPSAAASTAPSAAASAAPSAAASAAASGGAATLTITAPVGAATGGFQPTSLEAKANTPLTIHFDNQDSQAPHNVQLKGPAGDVPLGGDTAFFTGPGTRDYTVPALATGEYEYTCQVHPTTMKGSLTVK